MQQLTTNRMWRKVIWLILLAVLFAVGTFTSTFAGAAHAATQGEHCLLILAPLQPGETTSHVLSRQCAQGNQKLVAPASSTHLMRWWADINHTGAFTDVNGSSGPCDSTGYGINYVGDAWNDRISSFQVFNNCTFTRAYANANYGGFCQGYNGDIDFVGGTLNDHISSFRIASVQSHC